MRTTKEYIWIEISYRQTDRQRQTETINKLIKIKNKINKIRERR